MKKRMALFANTGTTDPNKYGFPLDHEPDNTSDLMRVSEWVEIQFPALTQQQIADGRLVTMNARRKRLAADYKAQCEALDAAVAKGIKVVIA